MSNVFITIKMCYVQNQWYDISCAILYVKYFLEFNNYKYGGDSRFLY